MRTIDADALIEELNNNHFPGAPYVDAGISIAIGKVLDAPTIEPESHYDEWCTDCREYDQERHSCPRWNRVIRQTVEEYKAAQPERKKGRWINHRNDNGHNIADCDQCKHAIQWFDGDETPMYCCMCGSYNGGEQDG